MKLKVINGGFHIRSENNWVPLSTKEKNLVMFLSEAKRRVNMSEIKNVLWGHQFVSDSAVKKTICILRKKLNDRPNAPKFIQNERGLGYLWINRPIRQVDERKFMVSEYISRLIKSMGGRIRLK